MKFFPSKENPTDVRIVSQGIDTLVTSHIATNESDYKSKFIPFINKLEDLKEKAQDIESSNQRNRFVKASLLNMGQFRIYAQGMGMYRYMLENEDLTIFIANTKFEANNGQTPQIKVEMRAHYLFALSHKKAYQLVLELVSKIIGESRNLCNRIDLYTDVQGIKYDNLDEMCFQTNYKTEEFKISKHTKHKKVTGFSFGNGDFRFRIYDKVKEISLRKNKSFIMYKWIVNGYKKDDKLPVFRHEVQYRRAELSKFMPKNLEDETLFFFDMLPKLWHNAITKISWTDLSDDEILRIVRKDLKSDSIKKIFQRARQKADRLDFWSILRNWDNKLATQISKYKHVKEPQAETAKKFLKAYVGSTYKALGNDPQNLVNLIDEVTKELRDIFGITLHEYGELKTVSNFIEQSKTLIEQGHQVEIDHQQKAFSLYSKLCQRLTSVNQPIDKQIVKELNRADNFFQTLKVS